MNQKDGWQLSGDGPSAYEKYMVPAYTRTWAKEMVRRADLQTDPNPAQSWWIFFLP